MRPPRSGRYSAWMRKSNSENSSWRTRLHAGLEGARRLQFPQHLDRQRLAGLDVARDQRQHFLAPGEVLHELARQLDGVPRHAVDAGDARVIDARQHVMQAVTELVEQRQDFVVRQQRRARARSAA